MIFETDDSEFVDQIRLSKNFLNDCLKTNLAYNFKYNLYTSYFANLKKLSNNFIPISICGKAPNWYKGLQYKKLAPKWNFFKEWKENNDNEYYIKNFNEQILNNLKLEDVLNDLKILAESYNIQNNIQSNNICLICYEKSDDFCHRHLVANWFNKNGIQCIEIKK